MHTTCSFIMGLGINQGVAIWANGGSAVPEANAQLLLLAVGIHSVFNTVAIVLAFSGVFPVV